MQVRLLQGMKEVVQGAWAAVQFGAGETVSLPAWRAQELIEKGAATADLSEPQTVMAPAKSSRVRTILRQRTARFLESFR
jgi:hypothetical protein